MNSNRMQRGGILRGAVRCWGRMGGSLPALLAVGLLMSGCEEDSHESASDSAGVATVEGTWIADEVTTGALTRDLDDLGYSAVVVIGADGRFSIEVVLRDGTVETRAGSWRVEGAQLVLDADDAEPVSVAYTVDSDTLTITANLPDLSPGLPAITASLSFRRG